MSSSQVVELTLNGTRLEVEVGPAERLLDLLRYRLGLTGTKEGCAEGECGACTVYLDDQPVDSCLVLAAQADGRRVDTIEGLDPACVRPLLASGATQCGACTPGVAMTAEWVRRNPELTSELPLRELMAGNLCRCTGYDGIIDGLQAALGDPSIDATEVRTTSPTSAARPPRPLELAGVRGSGRIIAPTSLRAALEALAENPDAIPLAGATDLLVHWPANLGAHGRTYVDLGGVGELRGLSWNRDALTLGGLCTYWDVILDARASEELPLLREAARQVGAVQIQTRGTWAGNIVNASPAADGVPVLLAYDAVLTLESLDGREEIPLEEFYLGYKEMRLEPGQLITAITLPRRDYDVAWFDKVGSRAAQAITKVGVALTRSGDDWRVVANSVAPVVTRCRAVEALLSDVRAPGLDEIDAALQGDVAPIDDIRSTAGYRQRVLARLIWFGLARHVHDAGAA